MSEFPELQGYEEPVNANGGEVSEKDLLSREKELLGEEGAAEFVGSTAGDAQTSEPEGEYESQSNTNFAEDSASENISSEAQNSFSAPLNANAPTGAGPSAYVPQQVNLNESEFLNDWKTKNELEIERRDKVSTEKLEQTRESARKAIDDFYENYNSKKEAEISDVRSKAKEFEDKRDAEIGTGKGTTWSKAAQLMEGLGRPAEGVEPRDKSRFSELVGSLKGDANAPGAGGY